MDDWYKQVQVAYEAEAAGLVAEGYRRVPCQFYRERFVKGDEELVLTRTLAQIDWAPREPWL